jgi:TonB-dependent SusC/RagA subfamily outer membrane receptor
MFHAFSRALLPAGLSMGLLAGCGGSSPPPQTTPRPTETLTSEDIERAAPTSIEQLLMERFPGVDVRRASGGISIHIRGQASFYGSSEPLVVIDGIPIEQGPSGIQGLNPHDIASIKVLKNPAETAIYGVRGGNGVIVITTKAAGPPK